MLNFNYNFVVRGVNIVVKKYKSKKYNEEYVNEIYNYYINNSISMKEVALLFKTSETQIRFIFNKYNLKSKTSNWKTKRKFNGNFFNIIDTEEKAYWLGFIIADGCITSFNNSKRFSIGLSNKDYLHLLKLCKSIELTPDSVKIYKSALNKDGKQLFKATLALRDKDLYNGLHKNGVRENKSKLGHPVPDLRKHLVKHFIRGYFDGDGCINNSGIVSILGCKEFIYWINSYFNFNKSIIYDKDTYFIYTLNKKDSYIFTNYLYNNATIYLDRKYDRYNNMTISS